jgi:hypothetical protein
MSSGFGITRYCSPDYKAATGLRIHLSGSSAIMPRWQRQTHTVQQFLWLRLLIDYLKL